MCCPDCNKTAPPLLDLPVLVLVPRCAYNQNHNSWILRQSWSSSDNTTKQLTYSWFPSPLRSLPSFITNAHSSLLFAFCPNLFIFNSVTSFSASHRHLSLGLPIYIVPSGLLSKIFSATFVLSILFPFHTNFNLLLSIYTNRSQVSHNSPTSWLVKIPQNLSFVTAPYAFLNVFLSHVFNITFPFQSWAISQP